MSKLLISLLIGIAAGIIDVIPMIIQKLDKSASLSAFIHWVALGVIISYVQTPFQPWLKGLLVAELASLSVIVLVFKSEPRSVIPIILMSAVLGVLVGIATAKFAN
jgi:hypothetical protein